MNASRLGQAMLKASMVVVIALAILGFYVGGIGLVVAYTSPAVGMPIILAMLALPILTYFYY